MAKEKGWNRLSKFSDILQVLSFPPVVTSISILFGSLASRVPTISAFGLFGIACSSLGAYVLLCLAIWLKSQSKPRTRDRGRADEYPRLYQFVHSKWVHYGMAALILGSTYFFIDSRPIIPLGVGPSVVKQTIATYREMKSEYITGKAIIVSAIPRDSNAKISGKTFDKCQIIGPAVIAMSHCEMTGNKFQIPTNDFPATSTNLMDQIVLESRSSVVTGAVLFTNCHFYQCSFVGVGFAGGRKFAEKMRQSPTINTHEEPINEQP